MTSLHDLHLTRESTLAAHYAAAIAELTDKVRASPLKTEFHVYAGCVSEEICQELARRFNQDERLKAFPCSYGFLTTAHYLTVTYELPPSLAHARILPVEQPTVDSTVTTTEQVKVSDSQEIPSVSETETVPVIEVQKKESSDAEKKAVLEEEIKGLMDKVVKEVTSQGSSKPMTKVWGKCV